MCLNTAERFTPGHAQVPKQKPLKRRKTGSPATAAEEGRSAKEPAASEQAHEGNGDDSNDEDVEEEDDVPEQPSM